VRGYSVEICTRVVASIQKQLGMSSLRIEWTPVDAADRLDAVAKGKIDIECGTTTISLSRFEKVDFSLPTFVDGGSVLTAVTSKLERFADLASHRIAFIPGTTTERALKRQLGVPVVMHRASPAPFVDLRLQSGEMLIVGNLRLQALHTPGHTRDSMCLQVEDRVFTGDTLLIGGTGRTDLPTGDAAALFESLFEVVLKLDPALKVFPAHEYKGRSHSTIGEELAGNPRLQKRERGAYEEGHIAGARLLPRGQLELRVNQELTDPTLRILVYCEFGRVSTLATATLRQMGFQRAVALDGGMKAWREAGHAVTAGKLP